MPTDFHPSTSRCGLLIALLFTSLSLCSCDSSGGSGVNSVVYGQDDRQDYHAQPDEQLRDLTRSSIVAMIPPNALDMSNSQDVQVRASSLQEAFGLCSGERFATQPTAASCSGTLIDDDLVMTAGHCVESGCDGFRYVFNYYYETSAGLATITAEDVYQCKQVAAMRYDEGGDWAIVQLDRPATPRHQPVAQPAESGALSARQSVTIIGCGSGLPFKIDTGGFVVDPRASTLDAFTATTDAFGGNSGSGVFNTDREVVGILVAGATDYVDRGGCYAPSEQPSDGSTTGGETITYALNAVRGLCETGWPSARLCGTDATCGDQICSTGESDQSCPSDCAVSTSSDVPPVAWTCSEDYYKASDDCDCNCGAYDPDCDNSSLRVYGCAEGDRCGGDAVCRPPAELPEAWTCSEREYDAANGCHCGCGAPDPDCALPDAEVLGCLSGQYCNDQGSCDGEPNSSVDIPFPTGDGESTECSVTSSSSSPSPLLGVAFLLSLWFIRRERRRDASSDQGA